MRALAVLLATLLTLALGAPAIADSTIRLEYVIVHEGAADTGGGPGTTTLLSSEAPAGGWTYTVSAALPLTGARAITPPQAVFDAAADRRVRPHVRVSVLSGAVAVLTDPAATVSAAQGRVVIVGADQIISLLPGDVISVLDLSATVPLPSTGGGGGGGTTNGLTDAQLRASPLAVSGSVTTGGLTDQQLRATPVPVSGSVTTGGLTDQQLRATPVPVSGSVNTGGLTDTQLRASAVPVSTGAPQLIANPTSVTLSAAGQIAQWTVAGNATYYLTLTPPAGATSAFVGSVAFEVSTDLTTWTPLTATPVSGPTAQSATTASAVGLWAVRAPKGDVVYIRARADTWTSGTVLALIAPAQAQGMVTLPWRPTVTAGVNLVDVIDTSGMAEISVHVSAVTGAAVTAYVTNDPTLTTWDTIALQSGRNNSGTWSTISAAGVYRLLPNGYRWAKFTATTTGTVLTVQGLQARFGDQVALGGAGNSLTIDAIVSGAQVIARNAFWSAQVTITRPANTTAYTATATTGWLVNNSGQSTLPVLSTGLPAGTRIQIQNITVLSSNGAASPKAQFALHFFSTNTYATTGGATLVDGQPFQPTLAALASANNNLFGSVGTQLPLLGPGAYGYKITMDTGTMTVGSGGAIFPALVGVNNYQPTSGEQIVIMASGTY